MPNTFSTRQMVALSAAAFGMALASSTNATAMAPLREQPTPPLPKFFRLRKTAQFPKAPKKLGLGRR